MRKAMTSTAFHKAFPEDHCAICGVNIDVGGPSSDGFSSDLLYGWGALHLAWHRRNDST